MSTPTTNPGVKSALRTLDLIEYVVARPSGATAREISAALTIPMSSLSYLLATLAERGYLRRDGRNYLAGERLQRLRGPIAESSLPDLALPYLRRLRDQLNETATMFSPVGWEVEALATETAGQPLRYSIDVGTRAPMHCVAAGKALLSLLKPEEIEEYLSTAKRERFTEFTVTGRKELLKQLDEIRATGVAFARNEFTLGITAVATAVTKAGSSLAISVAGPSLRMTAAAEDRAGDALRSIATAIAGTGSQLNLVA